MGKDSSIEWTTHTYNPWRGCHKVSPGCKYCYMFTEQAERRVNPNIVVRAAERTFTAPLRWKEPAYIFTCSYSDFFIEEADLWRDEVWEIIKKTPHLTYQILTKRPANILDRLPSDWGNGYPNVWLGVSTENQDLFDIRVPQVLEIPARLYFISAEPLLGPLSVSKYNLQWVIVGGESGFNARPMELVWVYDIIKECSKAGLPVFIKQLGTYWAKGMRARQKKGQDPNEWPPVLRIREMP